MTAPDEVRLIPLGQILEPRIVLRLVDRRSVEFMEMVESITEYGILNSVLVRPTDREPGCFEIIDGFYRLSCCKQIGIDPMPCIVKHNLTDEQVLALQIQTNAHRIETKPAEYARHLKRILNSKMGIGLPELVHIVKRNPRWIKAQLDLLTLSKKAQSLVDAREMPVQSAYMLAKIPSFLREQYTLDACAMAVPAFKALAASVIKQFQEQCRQGKLDEIHADKVFEPHAYQRSIKEVETEIAQQKFGPMVVVAEKAESALEGFYLGLKWSVHRDRQSVDEQRRLSAGRKRDDLKRLLHERNSDPELND